MTHPTDDSLKPCPFCGSPAEYDDEIPLMVSVQCTQCECMTNGHGDHEEAARTWNKRAEIRSEEISLLNAPAPLLKAEQAKDAAEDAPSDQVIELAGALEVRRILEAIKEVANLRPANDKITFDAAWQLCCEEIFYRATGCRWHMDEDAERFSRAARAAERKA